MIEIAEEIIISARSPDRKHIGTTGLVFSFLLFESDQVTNVIFSAELFCIEICRLEEVLCQLDVGLNSDTQVPQFIDQLDFVSIQVSFEAFIVLGLLFFCPLKERVYAALTRKTVTV